MSNYCIKCGNQVSAEENFCRQCGNAIAVQHKANEQNEQVEQPKTPKISEKSKQPNSAAVTTYEFVTQKPTFRLMSSQINTKITVNNDLLNVSAKCRSQLLNEKGLSGRVRVSDITSVLYKQYAVISWLDMFCFTLPLIFFLIGEVYGLAYAVIVGCTWWRALIPSIEIRTRDNRKINILFSPEDDRKNVINLVSKITGKNVDKNSEIIIPFSKEPFIAAFIALLASVIIAFILI